MNREIGGSLAAMLLMLVAAAVLLVPGSALALHNPSVAGQDGTACGHCHNLSAGVGATELGTSMIISSSRTLTPMKAANSGTVPATFGCTYCHSSASNTVMKGVLNHFRDDRSRHPIGERFVGFASTAARPDTGNEYLSNRNGTTGAADELECLDCHDQNLVDDPANVNYVDHVPLGTGGRINNPYMLKSVAAAGQYDALCRTCHGAGAPATFRSAFKADSGIAVKLVSHKDGSNNTTNAMTEMDGTVLRTADLNGDGVADPTVPTNQCTQCHGAHTADQVKLFSDAVGSGQNCTTLCHYAGDNFGNFTTHGHGKALSTYEYGGIQMDMDMACTNCHVPLDTTTTDKSVRKKHAPKTAIPAVGDRAIYKANFNLTGNVNSTDPGTATGNPQWGICINCHSLIDYKAHISYEGAPTGCQDCHDEHAEGSGAASNVFMIPEKSKKGGFFKQGTPRAGTETITYAKARFQTDGVTPAGTPYDFYRADGAGVCDNTECHGASYSASNPGPLSSLMTANRHSGGDRLAGIDCETCHKHQDPQGGWGASASCDDCHASLGKTHNNASESKPTHDTHLAALTFVSGCPTCHPHDGSSIPYGTPPHGDGTVTFGGTRMTAAFNYSDSVPFNDATCATAANGCHDAETGEWKNGLNWYSGGGAKSACADCHDAGTTNVVDAGKLMDQGGYPAASATSATKHTRHVNNNAYVPGDCDDCHGPDATLGNHAGHMNGTRETTATAVFTSYAPATKTCVTSCHLANTTNDWTNAVLLACTDCHSGTYVGGGANLPTSGLHATTEASLTSQNSHDDLFKAFRTQVTPNATCESCHTATPTTVATDHANGTLTTSWNAAPPSINFAADVGFSDLGPAPSCGPTGTLLNCHDDKGAWKRWWSATADDNTADECDNCHGMFKGAVGTADDTWVAGISARHGGVDATGGLEANHTGSPAGGPCFQCHTADTVGSQTFYTFATQHRDGTIQLNSQVGFVDNGANVGCSGCHTSNGYVSFADGEFVMADTFNADAVGDGGLDRWGRLLQAGPAGTCASCHASVITAASGAAPHAGVNESVANHDTTHALASAYIANCDDCHTNNGPGTGTLHSDGTVNFKAAASGGRLDSTLNYPRTATFANTNCSAVNGCHDTDAGEWAANSLGTDVCVDCHRAGTKLLGTGKAPTSGLHAMTATNVQKHDETLAAGNCVNCHQTVAAAPATHIDGTWEADGAANQTGSQPRFVVRTGMTYAEAAPDSATCSGTGGLTGCHRDSGNWSRLWSTAANVDYIASPNPGQAVCNVCHGQFAALVNSTGWRAGTSHFRAGDGAAEDKGTVHTDPLPAGCEDCHAYTSGIGALHDSDSKINFSDGGTTNFNASYATAPNRWYCSTCHDGNAAEVPTDTATHTFPDSLAFPGMANTTHTDGASEPTGCSGCHGNSANDTFWPDTTVAVPAPISGYPDRDGAHVKHVTVIVARFNADNAWTVDPTTDRLLTDMTQVDQVEICILCHSDNTPSTGWSGHYTSGYGASDATRLAEQPANVGQFNPIWNKAATDADGAMVTTLYTANLVTAPTSGCSAIDCHNGKTSTTGAPNDFRWYGANTSACVMCHVDVTTEAPTSGSHVPHLGTTTRANGGAIACASCHDAATDASTNTPPAVGHINGTFAVGGAVSPLTYTGVYPAKGTCNTNLCHNNGQNAANFNGGAAGYTWGTPIGGTNSCDECHRYVDATPFTNTIATGSHKPHLISTTYANGSLLACASCHAAATAATHANGSVTLAAPATLYNGDLIVVGNVNNTGTCGVNVCHNSGQNTAAYNNTAGSYNWGTAIDAQDSCSECHRPAPITGSHTAHLSSTTFANGSLLACASCHAAATVGSHANGSVTLAAPATLYNGDLIVVGNVNNTGTCGVNVCHNDGQNAAAYNNGVALYNWGTGIDVQNSCSECHRPSPITQAHGAHLGAATLFGRAIACGDCHAAATAASHANASVTIGGTVNPSYGTGPEVVVGALGGTFAACGTNACHNNGTGTAPTANPLWNAAAQPDCSICHAATPTTGSHNTHEAATAYGPHPTGSTVCNECHQSAASNVTMAGYPTHINGSVTFLNRATPATPFEVVSGQIQSATNDPVDSCNNCHGGLTSVNAAAGAKDSWAAATRLACGSCHGQNTQAWSAANGTGVQAPDIMGDAVNFGSDITGHSRAAGNYVSGNAPANKTCATCHTTTSSHIDGLSGTGFAAHRIQGTINAQAVSTVEGTCNACHQSTGGEQGTQVSRHGNSSAGYTPIEGAMTAIDCTTCHEPHGLVNGGGTTNMSMFRYSLTTPFGARNVVLTARTGANSFDETGDATNADQLDDACATCHINGSSASTLVRHTTAPAGGGIHEANSTYTGDDRGNNCIACHTHNYDANANGTADGFMPQPCDACHSYPGSAGGADWTLSGVHNVHVNAINAATPGYAYPCTTCHFGYPVGHNGSGYTKGKGWSDANVPPAQINIRFDPARNPGTDLTYGGVGGDADVGTTGISGHAGACANLLCHGQDTTRQTDWAAHASPSWGAADPGRLLCTSCHTDAPTSGAHALHANNTGTADRSDCNLCHTSVGLIDAATPMVTTHVDGTAGVLLTWTGATAPLYADGYCSANTCHASGATDGRWNETVLNCDACHYYSASPTGTGNTSPANTFRAVSKNSHDAHFDAPNRTWSCADCHPDNTTDTAGAASSTIGLVHVTPGAGSDAAILTDKAVPVQNNALVPGTVGGTWFASTGVPDWTDTTNICANRCHNPSADGHVSTAWGTTNVSCTFCHNATVATPPATGSHVAHVGPTIATYGLTVTCTSCHPDWVTSSAYGHMSGTVNLVNMTGLTYGGGGNAAVPYGAPFGTCSTTTCHNSGKGAVPTSTWGFTIAEPSCAICHTNPPAAGNDGIRHTTHDASLWVPDKCGSCHTAPNNKTSMAGYATHVNGSVDMGGTATVAHVRATGVCTNDCHTVSAATGDWLDAVDLACSDCHTASGIGTAPATGLHDATTAMAHDDQFRLTPAEALPGSATCTHCHAAAGPSSTHLTGPNGAAPQASNATTYTFNAANMAYTNGGYPTLTTCQANCHADFKLADAAGRWQRLWLGATDAVPLDTDGPGDAVCDNCHGDGLGTRATWNWDELNASTTDHVNPDTDATVADADLGPKHSVCTLCHGWGNANYNAAWGGPAPGHGDGSITMNGPDSAPGPEAGAAYDDTTGGCMKACHSAPPLTLKTNSGWPANYGDFGAGDCEGCHNGEQTTYPLAPNVMGPGSNATGSGSTPKPYDDGAWGYNVSGHGANGTASTTFDTDISESVTNILDPDAGCDDCHTLQSHHNNGVLNNAANGSLQANTYHLSTTGTWPFLQAGDTGSTIQTRFDSACYNRCHAGASVSNMRHAFVASPVSQFGNRGTLASGEDIHGRTTPAWPIDSDLTTGATTTNPDYVPCVSCHEPHGTDVSEANYPSNRMLRAKWSSENTLCFACHL